MAEAKKTKKKPRRVFRKKPCRLCRDKVTKLDYKDVDLLSRFVSDRGKILPTRISGNCVKHQRMVANKVKRARIAGLLPFVREKSSRGRLESSRFRRDRG